MGGSNRESPLEDGRFEDWESVVRLKKEDWRDYERAVIVESSSIQQHSFNF